MHAVTNFNYYYDLMKSSGYSKRVMSISLARRLLGYNPEWSLFEGLKETWSWFLAHEDEYKARKNYFKEQ
jgi:nucleoside-diphosphate-sugar epimerase